MRLVILLTRDSLCSFQLYFCWYNTCSISHSCSRLLLSLQHTFLIALPHSWWSSELMTKCKLNGTFIKSSPNPNFRLTRMGIPADNASRPVKPKPKTGFYLQKNNWMLLRRHLLSSQYCGLPEMVDYQTAQYLH